MVERIQRTVWGRAEFYVDAGGERKSMNKRQLGNTDLYLSEIGYGCASIWGKSFFPEEQSIKLFEEAVCGGISFFDTGFSYDNAEERLGKCLQQIGNDKRKELIIASKCGTRISDQRKYYHDWSVEWMKRSVDISLKRLHTDYLDVWTCCIFMDLLLQR